MTTLTKPHPSPVPPSGGFPPFDLTRLLATVFEPTAVCRICILTDFENPAESFTGLRFMKESGHPVQKKAVEVFCEGLANGTLQDLGMTGGEIFACRTTHGSNLDMEDPCWDISGNLLSLDRDIYPNYDIILCVTSYSATAPLTARAEFGRGWTVIVGGAIGAAFSISALPFYTLGVFVKPIAEATGWSREAIQLGFTVQMMVLLSVSWLWGWLVDRFGARRIALIAQVGLAAALALLPVLARAFGLEGWYLGWALVALFGGGTGQATWTRGISGWFDKARGGALGLALFGTGIAAVFAPPIVTNIITNQGWPMGYHLLGLSVVVGALLALAAPWMARSWLGAKFESAGRMAFSNYLSTSIITAFVFCGYGLGLYGQLHRAELYRANPAKRWTARAARNTMTECARHGAELSAMAITAAISNGWQGLVWDRLQYAPNHSPNGHNRTTNRPALTRNAEPLLAGQPSLNTSGNCGGGHAGTVSGVPASQRPSLDENGEECW